MLAPSPSLNPSLNPSRLKVQPVRKQAVPSAAPQLALDLPLSARGEGSSALPRLPFEAASDDGMDMLGGGGGGGRSVMAL